MSFSAVFTQLLNGLASASSLFLVAAGLSIIFGVTRIVNFAHGSLYMLGTYTAYSLVKTFGGGMFGFWGGVLCAGVVVGLFGALVERLLLRRLYRAPELLQLLATFALVLIVRDFALWTWGAEDLLGPRAPGLAGAVDIAGRQFPEYDLFLIVLGPVVLGVLWLLLTRTRWGTLVRAATEDREMAGALGVNQAWLFTSVFALGSFLAGLGGAIQIPREPAVLTMDLTILSDVFVVVVVGGMGSIPGAFLAAVIIGVVKAFCIGIGNVSLFGIAFSFSKLTLVVEFIVMAVVLVIRPWGLMGRQQGIPRGPASVEPPLYLPSAGQLKALAGTLLLLALLPLVSDRYTLVLLTDILVFALFAVSLQFIMGPAGMHSFGHAAYFGLGAYAAALLFKHAVPMEAALLLAPLGGGAAALVFGWFCVRLSGVYLAMLTLAFAQIAWSVVYQWDSFTGGSNGLVGIWPAEWLAGKTAFYYLALALCAGGILALWRSVYSPFGYALRAGRDSPLRADAIGIDVRRQQWLGFALAGVFAGLAGAVHAFSKGSISPDTLSIPRSVDGLVMVLMGGIQTLTGAVAGAALFTWLQDTIARQTEFWRALLGGIILFLVLAFPQGIAGYIRERWEAREKRRMIVLRVSHLSKAYGGVQAVSDVSFGLRAGELLALIGPNGAGKTTCFNLLNGQIAADSGSAEFEGRNLTGLKPRQIWRLGVGRTFQITATFASMTVRENVQTALLNFHGKLNSVVALAERLYVNEAMELLARVGIAGQAARPCAVLAYGDLKRVELAIALANRPRLLLMDEPTAGMAPHERVALMQLTAELARASGIAVLFTEHDMDVVFAHADRIIVLNRGSIIAEGKPAEVRANREVQEVYLGSGSLFGAAHA